MNLTDILKNSTKRFGDKPALIMRMSFREVRLTYNNVRELAERVGQILDEAGVKMGDKVVIIAPNSPLWICAFWGILLRGAVAVPLNYHGTKEFLNKVIAQTEAKVVFKYRGYRHNAPKSVKVIDVEDLASFIGQKSKRRGKSTRKVAESDDIAEIVYTSGTTGDPKGVVLTHGNILSNVEGLSGAVPLSEKDRMLSILPLSHMLEQVGGFLIPYKYGATIIYAHSPSAIPELLKEYRITMMVAVPEFLQVMISKMKAKLNGVFDIMIAAAKSTKSQRLKRLIFRPVIKALGGNMRMIACGGAALDPELETAWNAFGVEVMQGYGLTETSPALTSNTVENRRVGSVGRPVAGTKLKIAPDGEILAKGPNVFRGYYKNPKKTAEVFTDDGWFKTDDLGEIDKDGFLFIKGRKRYLILGPSGENIYPDDIEFVLNNIDGVKDSCVVGLDKAGREIVHAAILLNDGIKESAADKIVREANRKLAKHERISSWTVWLDRDFPRSATRKIQKEIVLGRLQKQEEGAVSEHFSPLIELIAEISGVDAKKIPNDSKFIAELGFDSLLRVELASRIASTFRVEVDESMITPEITVDRLDKIIKETKPGKAKRPFRKWPLSPQAGMVRKFLQHAILFPYVRSCTKLEVRGLENLHDLPGPVLYLPNHLSYLDSAAVIMSLPPDLRPNIAVAGAKDVVFDKYLRVSWFLELLVNVYPLPRKEGEDIERGLEFTGRMLDYGCSVIVFPEGKMSKTGKLQPLKRGAGLMATSMNVEVVPVCLEGTNDVIPHGKILPRKRGTVKVTFGKPLKFKPGENYIEATVSIEKELKKLCGGG